MVALTRNKRLAKKLCLCIKKVRKTVKVRSGPSTPEGREKAAIGICVKSVLQTRGRTLRRFSCKKGPKLTTKRFVAPKSS